MPGVFFPDYVSVQETQALQQLPQEYISPIMSNLTDIRKGILTSDCWRSFFVILAGTVVLVLALLKKLQPKYAVALLFALCLVDMWQVNKRYLNDAMFVERSVHRHIVEEKVGEPHEVASP